jgi:hypothetical protein
LNNPTFELKMLPPMIPAGIIEAHEFLRLPDDRADVAAFVAIAKDTGIDKIASISGAIMLQADGVVDCTSQNSVIGMNEAVFAQVVGAIANQSP